MTIATGVKWSACSAALLITAACGGGGGGGVVPGGGGSAPVSTPTATPSATPVPGATAPPSTGTSSASAGAIPAQMNLGLPNGFTTLMQFGVVTSAAPATISATLSSTNPSSLAPARMKRRPAGLGTATQLDPLVYVALTASATVVFNRGPGLLAQIAAGTSAPNGYWLGLLDESNLAAGWTIYEGPEYATGTSLAFPQVQQTFTLTAGVMYVFVLYAPGGSYATPAPGGSPSSSPSPAGTATPAGATPTPIPTAAVQAAPAIGYLAADGGGFGGHLTGVTHGATLVLASTAQPAGSPGDTLQFETLALGQSGPVGTAGASRRTAAAMAPLRRERPGAAQRFARLRSQLRPSLHAARASQAERRAQSLGTSVGSTASLWTYQVPIGTDNGSYVQLPATLQAVTAHGYIWVDSSLSLPASSITSIGNDFENAYASDTTHFGSPAYTTSSAGYDPTEYSLCNAAGTPVGGRGTEYVPPPADGRTVVFVINDNNLGSGEGGYFDGVNYFNQEVINCLIGSNGYTAATIPKTNGVPMIYVGYDTDYSASFETGEDLARGTAHEFQHDINFVNHILISNGDYEEPWIDEGMAVLAQDLALPRLFSNLSHDAADALYRAQLYTYAPQNVALHAMTGIDQGQSAPAYYCDACYGAAFLYQRYLYDRFGGDTYLHNMLHEATGSANITQATGSPEAADQSDFAIALAASGDNVVSSDVRFALPSLSLTAPYGDQFGRTLTVGAPATIGFAASESVPVGAFAYVGFGTGAQSTVITANDAAGLFGLAPGIVQY